MNIKNLSGQNLDIVLQNNSLLVLTACVPAEETGFEIIHFRNFRDLDLDLGSGHAAYRHASLIDLYLHAKYRQNRGKIVDIRTDIETQRSRRKNQHSTEVQVTSHRRSSSQKCSSGRQRMNECKTEVHCHQN